MGCAAALATSSMVTELAKGKTIEDALKISKDDIARELGGLPPVKYHCSILSSDGLTEAIYDYYTRTKQAIPQELEKKHERLQKELRIVEARHGHEHTLH